MKKKPISYKAEVLADDSGKWATNALRFSTWGEAFAYGEDLGQRWTLVREMRAAPSDEPVNSKWENGRLESTWP